MQFDSRFYQEKQQISEIQRNKENDDFLKIIDLKECNYRI